ncbi:MAG TPA: 3-phosphoglycerate dehydrogenase [Bacteroidales bacterium]|nr:3-phosphoglycerate dehydrogenase [Bacteroidales bacterium]HPI86968.1 3-phosphoglycerate dehydrogenase [Bacteroidales bacterium]
MKKVLVATDKPFAAIAVKGIRQIVDNAGYELLLLEKYTDPADLLKAVEPADAMIVRSDLVTPEVIKAGKNLKIVVRAGAGFDNIDLPASTAAGVVVMNTPGQNSNAVAELVFGMLVYQIRNHFNGSSGTELMGKKLGLHAYGNVSKNVARIAKGFGMEVFAFDPFITPDEILKDGVTPVADLKELYSTCQIISLHIPANEKTKKSINFDLLSLMPKNAILANTARKEVICEDSLQRIFAEREDFRYVSDVAPDCLDSLKEKYSGRFFVTPKKMGAQTSEANVNAGLAAARQIVEFFEKGDIRFKVN